MDEMFAKLMGELEKLAENIGRLADMVGRVEAVKEAKPIKEEKKPEPVKEEKKPEPVKEEKKPEPVKEEKKPEPVKTEAKPEEKTVDVSVVRQALFQVMEKCGQSKAMELLATYGNAPTVGEVLPEKYSGIIAACQEALK